MRLAIEDELDRRWVAMASDDELDRYKGFSEFFHERMRADGFPLDPTPRYFMALSEIERRQLAKAVPRGTTDGPRRL